jgi:NTP pyrophosphatase (non-canonical NTP hydrolase)
MSVLSDVVAERDRQDAKWGEQNHPPMKWVAILAEEVGEVAEAALDGGGPEYRAEMVQAAAVCLAAVESFDRAARRRSA